jgi:ABC-type multidrug transport system ATPase subunit
VLFLDEPTTGVDPVSRKEFWGMLKKLKEQGITILVSTPYMDEATLCDRVALIQKGEIFKIDTPKRISESFPHKLYTIQSDDNYDLLLQLRQNPAVHSAYSFGDELHVIFNDELAMNNEQYKEIQPTIEDCFMDLLKD